MWYLDRVAKICSGQDGGIDPKAYHGSYFWETWETYHDHDPFATLSPQAMANRTLMLGSEVDMWGEGVDDTNFETRVFPRATAAAERMWSWDVSPAAAASRLANHRCTLVAAGVRVQPIGPGDECSIKNDECSIKNDEYSIKNDECSIENGDYSISNDGPWNRTTRRRENGELPLKNDDLTQNQMSPG